MLTILRRKRRKVKGKEEENASCRFCALCPTRDCATCREDHKKGHLLPSEEEKLLDFKRKERENGV